MFPIQHPIAPSTSAMRLEWFIDTVRPQSDSLEVKAECSTKSNHYNKIFYYYGSKCPAVYGNSDIK